MKRLLVLCCAVTFLAGCGIHVVPQPTPRTTLNTADRSLTQVTDGLSVSARVQDLEVAPYQLVDNITSFYLTIRNRTGAPVLLPLEAFYLVDNEGRQYRPLPPGQIQSIVSRDSDYLIPYPYVGFYYLEDAEQYAFANAASSSLPYYAENHPQDLFTRSLPVTSILPGALISGEIFFVIDLALKETVELRVFAPGRPQTGAATFIFPFMIEK